MLTPEVVRGFVGSCLVKNYDAATQIPNFHDELWQMCCSKDRFVAMALPRSHAKSTSVTFAYGLASLLFRDRKYAIIVSDSETQACMFLGQMKIALQNNEDIISLFGVKRNNKGLVEFEKDSESDIIVEFTDGYKFRVTAKGSEQKMRGLLWDSHRPDLILLDDMESDEQVLNKERRDKFRRWFTGALIPILSRDGIIRYVGTILHSDSMLENLMPNKRFGNYEISELKESGRNGMWKSVKYKAHNPDFSQILWSERFSKEELKIIQLDYKQRGLSDVYSQEYLNAPIDELNAFFKKTDIVAMNQEDKKRKLIYYIAGDLAISETQKADYTVFVVGGMDEEGVLYIKQVIRDRLDGVEIVDTMLALQKVYSPLLFAVEDTQITKALGPYLNREMLEKNVIINIELMRPHRSDKKQRAQSIRARMRAGGVKVDKSQEWFMTFEDELLQFNRGKHDDQVDALAYLGLLLDKLVEAPTAEEESEEEYEEMLHTSQYYEESRNQTTGY